MALPLGYGRSRAGAIGTGVGANVYGLRTTGQLGYAQGAQITKTGRTHKLATTQEHWTIAEHHLLQGVLHDRAIVREETLAGYHKHPDFVREMGPEKPTDESIYAPPPFTGQQQWGLVVDLTKCVGCGACVVACQAENNIPIVGKAQVLIGREMHWLRQDRYFCGDPEGDVQVSIMPMMCQHCEQAPCEPVLPGQRDGTQLGGAEQMVYNRCIGTRYCSNNCPYKVRRFNFLDFNKGTLYEPGWPRTTGQRRAPRAG